jgi:GNAT superfamily N-acetyltransferase
MDDVSVRTGVEADFNGMMDIALAATRENAVVAPDVEKLALTIWGALTRQTGICGVIGPVGGKLEGAVLLSMGEMWYSRELILEEKAIYVDPDYRAAKGGRARKLAEFAKMTANELDIPLAIGVLSSSRTEAKVRLYERVFGAPAGVYFLHGAKTGLENGADGGS